MRSDIACPGDTISYNCSISESLNLVWSVTIPGSTPLSIMYDSTSMLNSIDNLDVGVSTMLTQYRSDDYIESIIVFTVLMGVTFNQTDVQCSIPNLNIMSTIVFVNTSGIETIFIALIVLIEYPSPFSSPQTYWIQHHKRILYSDGHHSYV